MGKTAGRASSRPRGATGGRVPYRRGTGRVVSGMRPTGKLHLGNYLGALDNWVRLQEEFRCFFFVADWHALTTGYAESREIPANLVEMVADWLGAGLDPKRATLFIQSHVPEHAELHILFSMLTPIAWLERSPTFKETVSELGIESPSYGLLGYPVLQAADILIYKANFVPVGVDQLPHIELCREIARRFNHLYRSVFPEPQAKLTEIPKVPGTDGRKMSKSYGNAIYLSDPPEVITPKINTMITDPARKRRSDPGNPEICPVFDLHKIFTPTDDREKCAVGCRTAGIGCLDCKEVLLTHLLPSLSEIRERREKYIQRPAEIREILAEGSAQARTFAAETLAEVKEAIGLV